MVLPMWPPCLYQSSDKMVFTESNEITTPPLKHAHTPYPIYQLVILPSDSGEGVRKYEKKFDVFEQDHDGRVNSHIKRTHSLHQDE